MSTEPLTAASTVAAPAGLELATVSGGRPAYGGRAGAAPIANGDRGRRLIGLVTALAGIALLSVAAWLDPSPQGLGTHEQLRLPTCGWVTIMDLPCPTCGMTTSFAHAADGDLFASFRAQPLGCLLALGTAMAVLLGAYVAVTGSRVGSVVSKLWGRSTGWLVAAAILVAWGCKILSYKGML